ncbi:MAG: flagellar protein FlaG [Gammaproteobacteria bacterium]
MNESISQQLLPVDAGLIARPGARSVQSRKVVAVAETDKSRASDGTSTQESNAKDTDSLPEMVEALNTRLQDMQRGLRFSVDDSSGRIVVKVIDLDTEEVIRQIPSEEMLTIMHNASDSLNLIFNDEA